jgi:hypothetical protein
MRTVGCDDKTCNPKRGDEMKKVTAREGKIEWELAKSNRSRCARCTNLISQFDKRLRVPAKFGTREGYVFYCEGCAGLVYDLSSISVPRDYSESVRKVVEGGQGRFYKHFRKITLE